MQFYKKCFALRGDLNDGEMNFFGKRESSALKSGLTKHEKFVLLVKTKKKKGWGF